MSLISIRLLGGVSITANDQPIRFAYEKGRALLAFLAVENNRRHSRHALANMFWPELEREAALGNLRLVLHDLRKCCAKALGESSPPPFESDRESVRFIPCPGIEVDIQAFTEALPQCHNPGCDKNCTHCLEALEAIAKLYRGEFMAQFELPGCSDFADWQGLQQETLRLRMRLMLTRLAICLEENGREDKALLYSRQLLNLDPLNEDALRRTMRLLSQAGQRGSALGAFEAFAIALQTEIELAPEKDTQVLAEKIRNGQALTKQAAASPPEEQPKPSTSAKPTEMCQISVLNCLLSPLPTKDDRQEGLDHEALLADCSRLVGEHAGHLVRIHGCGFLAYFGFPYPVEKTALAASSVAQRLSRHFSGKLITRIGIHTARVRCTENPPLPDVEGLASEMAISLRQLAPGQHIVVSKETRALIAQRFRTQPFPSPTHAAHPDTLEAFSLLSAEENQSEHTEPTRQLFGRDRELAQLRVFWQAACTRRIEAVLVRGEAGIGKTHLITHFGSQIASEETFVQTLRCTPDHSHSAFHPVLEMLGLHRFLADTHSKDIYSLLFQAAKRLRQGTSHRTTVPLAHALGIEVPERIASQHDAPPIIQRERLSTFLLACLTHPARQSPLLLIIEDVHWADPSTLELLEKLISSRLRLPILCIGSARPEFILAPSLARIHPLPLAPLASADCAALVCGIAPQASAAQISRIVERAEGIPLFAEELTRGFNAGQDASIPASLEDVLGYRLNLLGQAKTTAQMAATIGREFDVDFLKALHPADTLKIDRNLSRLLDALIIQQEDAQRYRFRHALIRDAAYQSQPPEQRQKTHASIAEALHQSPASTRPEQLAYHWAQAGQTGKAIKHWLAAGRQAMQQSASREALAHFHAGVALLQDLGSDDDRVQHEAELQLGIGMAAAAIDGYSSRESTLAFIRATELQAETSLPSSAFAALWGRWSSSSSGADRPGARHLARQMIRQARRSGDPVYIQQSRFAYGVCLFWEGRFAAARSHLEFVRQSYRREQHARHVAEFGEDAGVTSAMYLSWTLWFLGETERATKLCAQGIKLAQTVAHPFSEAYAHTCAAFLYCRLRFPETALEHADSARRLADRHGYALWQIGSEVTRGWAMAQLGHSEAIARIEPCVAAVREVMLGGLLSTLGPLLESNLMLGRVTAAQDAYAEANAAQVMTQDRHLDAELLRLRGEILIRLAMGGDPGDAADTEIETCFLQALAIARHQRARALELRTVTSLARYWGKRGRAIDSISLLDSVLQGFQKMRITPDRQDASDLLADLTEMAQAKVCSSPAESTPIS